MNNGVFDRVSRLAREPLIHFLVAGALIFALWGGAEGDSADRSITVEEARVRTLAQQWQLTWHRQPTPAEIDGLIREHVKDEVYYREALRLGLDKEDITVRRRMRAKMEFFVAAQAESEVPSDMVLQTWLDRHQRDYATAASLSFDQIYLGDQVESARVILDRLSKGADPATMGSRLSMPSSMEAAPSEEIDRLFGDGVAKALARQQLGRWAGPVSSGFGQHLVRVRRRVPGQVPALATVRKAVENDWREANRATREAKAYQALLDGYTIRIAKP